MHFDHYNKSVQYEFGYGLSYTTFDIAGDAKVKFVGDEDQQELPAAAKTLPGGNPRLWDVLFQVSVSVKNTGSNGGFAVPQLYLSLPRGSVEGFVAKNVLRGFEKIHLKPQETHDVTFNLSRRDISHWNAVKQQWAISKGEAQAHVGFSSRDFRTSVSFRALELRT